LRPWLGPSLLTVRSIAGMLQLQTIALFLSPALLDDYRHK